jgi:hypothetical protein
MAYLVSLFRSRWVEDSATDEQSHSRDRISFKERWEAARIVLHVIKQRAKLFRYEDVESENQRKLQAEYQRLLIKLA